MSVTDIYRRFFLFSLYFTPRDNSAIKYSKTQSPVGRMGVGWKPGVSPLFGLTLDRYMPLFWVLGLKLEHDVCQAGYSG